MGTLVRLDPPGPRLRRELAARFGLTLSPAEAERAMAAEIAYYRAHMHDGTDAGAVSALRLAAAEALRSGLPDDRRLPDVSDAELARALVASLQFSSYADVIPTLVWARRRGLTLVVVSNWDSSLPEVLDRVGVGEYLDGVITSAGAGAAKPDPAIFRSALALAGVPAPQALHVGDSLAQDVAGAQAAGVRAVWLDRTAAGLAGPPANPPIAGRAHQLPNPPTSTISSLSELSRLA
jgi:putative hydrolase of the HAD superfamily